MANIAQMVNVLQAVILTEGEKMILTPTYHVFKMYNVHQGAELLDSHLETEMVGLEEQNMVPCMNESVSMSEDGKVHITLTNMSVDKSYDIDGAVFDSEIKAVKGEIVTGEMHEHNTFDAPDVVKIKEFNDVKTDGGRLMFTIPPCSVMHLEVTI
jgi:alpha-N-arabinofuranosidase